MATNRSYTKPATLVATETATPTRKSCITLRGTGSFSDSSGEQVTLAVQEDGDLYIENDVLINRDMAADLAEVLMQFSRTGRLSN